LVRFLGYEPLPYWTSCCNAGVKSIISKSPMAKTVNYVSGAVLFLGGVIAGILTAHRPPQASVETGGNSTGDPVPGSMGTNEWKRAIASLESRMAAHENAAAARFQRVELSIQEHAAKLAEAPSTGQIISAMEQLLSKTMGSLDDRLTTQAHSIEVLKTTVSQTDSLLERVLESLDSLQSESPEGSEEGIFSRAV
jgi:hypothetical protein